MIKYTNNVDTAFRFMGNFLNCLVGCFCMTVRTPVVLSVLSASVLHFCKSAPVQSN